MGSVSDWLFWVAGGVAAVAGLAMVPWALFADRSRKRLRCPKCWYDLCGTPAGSAAGLACPECGRAIRSDRELLRTRRRWKLALFAAVVSLAGISGSLAPSVRSGQWITHAPTTVLILTLPFIDDSNIAGQIIERVSRWDGYLRVTSRDPMWGWQRVLLTHTAAIAAERNGLSLPTRQMALAVIGNLELDPGPALDRLLRLLENPNPKLRAQAAMELHCVLYRLGPELDRCLKALEPLRDDLDQFTAEQAKVTLLFGEWLRNSRASPNTVTTLQSITPDIIEQRLNGKGWIDMVHLWSALDLPLGIFTRPYTLDPGPFRVTRFDLDIDGKGDLDTVVRIGDKQGVYWQFLIFLRRPDGWVLADSLETNNQPGLDPEPRSVVLKGAGTFLVIRKTTDNSKKERAAADTWLRVTGRTAKVALYLPVEDHCAEPPAPLRTARPDIDLRTTFESGADTQGPWIGYAIEAVYAAGWAPGTFWPADVADVMPRNFELFRRSGQIRFRWSRRHDRLETDAASSTWTLAELEGVRLDSPEEFVAHNSDQLANVVGNESKEAKEWLRLFLPRCANTPECRALGDLLEHSEVEPPTSPPER